jgi:hypothetical protein
MESTKVINGVGLPRLIVIKGTIYTSAGATTFTSNSVTEAGSPNFGALQAGHRVTSFVVSAGHPNKPVYAKILSVDDVNDIIVVDQWIGGTPTNNQPIVVDGFVMDLPRCQEMTEVFTPDNLIHKLYRRRTNTKFYGWGYRNILDYSTFATGDMFLDLAPGLNLGETDLLILIPRKDAPQFQYNVYFADAINLSLYGKSPGYRKPVFAFQAKEDVASFPIVLGYGSGYGINYSNNGW